MSATSAEAFNNLMWSDDHHHKDTFLQLSKKYGLKSDSLGDTATTLTVSSLNSSYEDSQSRYYDKSSQSSPKSCKKSAPDLRRDLDSLFREYSGASSQPKKSVRPRDDVIRHEKEYRGFSNKLPPLSVHSRLAISLTKSTYLRHKSEQMAPKQQRENTNRPPFYTIARSNSFSETTVSSISRYTSKEIFAAGRTSPSVNSRLAATESMSPSIHSRLAATETIGSAIKKQQRRNDFSSSTSSRHNSNRRPFYTTVTASEPNEQNPRNDRRQRYSRSSGRANPRESVYDRLSKQGTASSLSKNRSSMQYKEEEKTFREHCKVGLMREFKGSTFVPVARGNISKSVIGSVINCGY